MATTIVETPAGSGGRRAGMTRARDRFYLWLAIACALVAIGGFMPTYWLQLAPRTFVGPTLLHIHGALCTAWVLFLVSQAWLVSDGRIRNHRDWGLAGIALATAVVGVGFVTAIVSLEAELARGYGDAARAFLATPLSAIFRFAVFTGAAIACVHRPEWHKRLMITGTVSLIEAAGARFGFLMGVGHGPGIRPGLFPPPPAAMPIIVGSVLQLIIVAGMIHDKRSRGSVHPAWIVGLVASLSMILLKVPLSHTAGWLAFADWTTHIAG
jgi:hypothetical protein